MGRALMGTGCAKGQGRARLAAEMAISSPLLDDISVEGATGVLINIVGGPDIKLREMEEAATLVQEQAHEDANIIFGASIDEQLGEMRQGHGHRDRLRSRGRPGGHPPASRRASGCIAKVAELRVGPVARARRPLRRCASQRQLVRDEPAPAFSSRRPSAPCVRSGRAAPASHAKRAAHAARGHGQRVGDADVSAQGTVSLVGIRACAAGTQLSREHTCDAPGKLVVR